MALLLLKAYFHIQYVYDPLPTYICFFPSLYYVLVNKPIFHLLYCIAALLPCLHCDTTELFITQRACHHPLCILFYRAFYSTRHLIPLGISSYRICQTKLRINVYQASSGKALTSMSTRLLWAEPPHRREPGLI